MWASESNNYFHVSKDFAPNIIASYGDFGWGSAIIGAIPIHSYNSALKGGEVEGKQVH